MTGPDQVPLKEILNTLKLLDDSEARLSKKKRVRGSLSPGSPDWNSAIELLDDLVSKLPPDDPETIEAIARLNHHKARAPKLKA